MNQGNESVIRKQSEREEKMMKINPIPFYDQFEGL